MLYKNSYVNLHIKSYINSLAAVRCSFEFLCPAPGPLTSGKLQRFPEPFDGARMRYCYKVQRLVQQAAVHIVRDVQGISNFLIKFIVLSPPQISLMSQFAEINFVISVLSLG